MSLLCTVLLCTLLAVGGCRSSRDASRFVGLAGPTREEAPRTVDLGAFATPRAAVTPEDTTVALAAGERSGLRSGAPAVDDDEDEPRPFRPSAPDAGGGAAGTVPAVPLGAASPDLTGAGDESVRRLAPGDRVIVDSMVGQVNGRPIFAEEFFEPIEDALLALARKTDSRSFLDQASQIVNTELQQVVLNALFLAEAQADLSPQERVGIFAWLSQQQEEVVAGLGGSEFEAERKLLEREERTLDEHLQYLQDTALIQKLWVERISPRVIVSWRDVERAYQQNYDQFNPPGRATLARIRFPSSRVDDIAEVTRRLEAGDEFRVVAADAGQPQSGTWQTFDVGPDGLAGLEFGVEAIRENVARLEHEGDTVGPFEVGTTTWWLHLAKVDRPEGRSLYDPEVQRLLTQRIRSMRSTEEQNRYIASLLEKGIYDELEAMADRLIAIAVIRYGP